MIAFARGVGIDKDPAGEYSTLEGRHSALLGLASTLNVWNPRTALVVDPLTRDARRGGGGNFMVPYTRLLMTPHRKAMTFRALEEPWPWGQGETVSPTRGPA